MKWKNAFLMIILLATAACSIYRIDSDKVSTNYYPAKKSAQEVTYLETITQPHELIGFVMVNTERRHTAEQVIEKMKREAAILGGDAITDISMEASGSWKKVPVQKLLGNAYLRANFRAKVVALK